MYTIQVGRRARFAALLFVAAFVGAARPIHAQEPALGRIEGEVHDSLHTGGLARATVLAVRMAPEPRTFASVYADDRGRFRFDSLAAGRYALSFSSPALDSLDIVIPDREVVLEPGERVRVELGMPSGATLRRAACPGMTFAPGQGAVVGTVIDAGTEQPLGRATVVVVWSDISIDKATMRAATQERTGAVQADSLGRYRLCGVPTDLTLLVQVQHGGASSVVVNLVVNDTVGLRRQDLSLMAADSSRAVPEVVAAGDTTRGAVAIPLATGTAVISGVVRSGLDRPLPDVDLRVAGARGSTRTDSLGRFTLPGMPGGTQMLEARRLGYAMARAPVELRPGRTVRQDMRLDRVVSLDSIRIIAQRSRYPEFERHRKNGGWGRYLDEADILRRNPMRTADLLRMMPGFRVVHRGFDDVIVSSRGPLSFSNRSCPMNIVIDGMSRMEIDMVHPADFAAMEAYPDRNGVPPEYALQSPCGAVIIWTKR